MGCIVYKYRLWRPTLNAELVDRTFEGADRYYDQLVDIENRRRTEYRAARSRLVPGLAEIEESLRRAQVEADQAVASVREHRRAARARAVPQELQQRLSECRKRRDLLAKEVRQLVGDHKSDPALVSEAGMIDARAEVAVKELRKTLYWGTYLLVEDAVKRAKKSEPWLLSGKQSRAPAHLRRGRIGIQIQGGITPAELVDDTRAQLDVPGIEHVGDRSLPGSQRKPRGIFRLRVGTVTGKRDPVWAEFPIKLHRALPADASIKWAVVTREPGHLYRPWIYHLCLTIETKLHERVLPGTLQEGTTSINFGWKLVGNTLRVATLNNEARPIEHVELPVEIYRRYERCKTLQSTIDQHFDSAKRALVAWIAERQETLPEAFQESFAGLSSWRSARRLSELVDYWREHRLPDDGEVFDLLWFWRGRWIHLYQWETCNRRRAQRSRAEFYRLLARSIVTTSAKVVVEDFDISRVARRLPEGRDLGDGQLPRENRTIAAVGELRECVLRAAAKYHCEVVLVEAENNTRRCNVCGRLLDWDPSRERVRDCPDCSMWDQDVNNTDNASDREASGEAVALVCPAKSAEGQGHVPSERRSFAAAREQLRKLLEKQRGT